jgi:hypothetical protein
MVGFYPTASTMSALAETRGRFVLWSTLSDLPKANLTAPDPPPGAGAIYRSHPRVSVAVRFAPGQAEIEETA